MAGEALGYIACGCGLPAAIKKLKNSENLYSHCTTCGCDRRTGEHIQAQFRAAIGVMELPENSGDIPDDESGKKPATALAGQEWAPTVDTHRKAPDANPGNNPENSGSGIGRKVLGGAVILLSLGGLAYKALRG